MASKPGAVSQSSLIRSECVRFLIPAICWSNNWFLCSLFRFKKTAGVADYTKGVTGVASLAKSNPDKAINNAEYVDTLFSGIDQVLIIHFIGNSAPMRSCTFVLI